tara:strand:- start:34 stop:516 length:483 start_codon:yes stop_codon:yes gene_type:complete
LKNYIDDFYWVVKPSKIVDARYIADNMREQDTKEVLALGHKPYDSLVYAISHDEAQTFTLFYGKEPVLIFGTVGEGVGVARLWMLATDKAFTKPKRLAFMSKAWVDLLQKPYNYIYNYVWLGNDKAIRLLEYLNCKFDKVPITKKNLNFVKFSRCKTYKN